MSEEKITLEKEKIMSKFGEINREVDKYYLTYNQKPKMIIISKQLSMGMQLIMSNQSKFAVGYGDEIYQLFGINCIESPKLYIWEYEIF